MNKGTITAVLLVVLLTTGTILGAVFMDKYKLEAQSTRPADSQTKQEEASSEPAETQQTPPQTPAEAAPSPENPQASAFEKEKGNYNLILTNAEHPLPEDFSVEVADVPNGFQADARIADTLRKMIEDADDQGVDLLLCSAYRTHEKQTKLFNAEKADYLAEGKSEEEARKLAAVAIAIPGTSEHETGLAVDIVTTEYQNLNEGFAETDAFQWLSEHAWEYGFILRYPKDKEQETGIMYEAWHYRYVGKNHAKLIKDSGLCLEEYLAQTAPEGFVPEEE